MKPDQTVLNRLGGGPRRHGLFQRTIRITLSALLVLSHPLWAATIIVDETTCTLVDAITAANTDSPTGGCPAGSGADIIELTTDVTLTDVDNQHVQYGDTGLPVVESDITIEGGGFTIERASDAPAFRLMMIARNATLTVNDATLSNGMASSNYARGAAIFNDEDGALTLTNSTVSGNSASGYRGAIFNYGASALLTNTDIVGNVGGGFHNYGYYDESEAWLTDCTVSDNTSAGVFNNVAITHVTNCTVSDNEIGTVTYGSAPLYVTNSSVSGNEIGVRSWIGGEVTGGGEVILANSTVSGNEIGIYVVNSDFQEPGHASLKNTIVGNSSTDNCYISGGPDPEIFISDLGHNFADDDSCGSGFASITPGVDFDITLADNGGPTPTHALFPASIAIDTAGYCDLATDQRGFPRDDSACDSGSFEFQAACGNGELDPGEECDDGNNTTCDGCSAGCTIEEGLVCGDGIPNVWCGEECDDGNNDDEDGCSAECIIEFCGDGIIQAGLGEQCDDGNSEDGDGCAADCTIEVPGTPATTGFGTILLVLALGGSSAYFMRRRTTT